MYKDTALTLLPKVQPPAYGVFGLMIALLQKMPKCFQCFLTSLVIFLPMIFHSIVNVFDFIIFALVLATSMIRHKDILFVLLSHFEFMADIFERDTPLLSFPALSFNFCFWRRTEQSRLVLSQDVRNDDILFVSYV